MGEADRTGVRAWLERWLPIVAQLRGYGVSHARADLVAALTIAVLLVPQAMAYAMLAGLPPIVGLYAATVPLVAYAVVGSSRYLSVGPVALVSLVVAGAVGDLAEPGSADYIGYAVLLALLVGIIQLALALVRAGTLVDLLAHPVIIGFTGGAALIIIAQQIPGLLGVDVARHPRIFGLLVAVSGKLATADVITMSIGGLSIGVLIALKRWIPAVPRALVIVVGATAVSAVGGFEARGVAVIGDIPSGLPGLHVPTIDLGAIEVLLPAAVVAVLVGFIEAFSVATVVAREDGDDVHANRELAGLGVANLAAAAVGGCPVGGAFSRTAVNAKTGARTAFATVCAGGLVLVTLAFLTRWLYHLPLAALAAVIVVAVAGLVDLRSMAELWRIEKRDFVIMALTFAVTLGLGVGYGVAVGAVASILVFLRRSARPHVVMLGRLPNTDLYRDADRHEFAEVTPDVVVARILAPAFFANARAIRDELMGAVERRGPDVRAFVIDAGAITFIDVTAEIMVRELEEELSAMGIELHLARLNRPVQRVLGRSGLLDRLAPSRIHRTVHGAVVASRAS